MTYLLVKFFDNESYVNDFLAGRIYANRLSYYKAIEDQQDGGRGDPKEGMGAWLQPGRGRLVINEMDMTSDLAGPIELQPNWLNHLNVFCLYAVHSGDLDPCNPRDWEIDAFRNYLLIPDRCFSLGAHAVVICNVAEFVRRMEAASNSAGYKVKRGRVKYYSPETFHGAIRGDAAAFTKQDRFSYQREFRFAIQTGSTGTSPITLSIGGIRDISKRYKSSDLNAEIIRKIEWPQQ